MTQQTAGFIESGAARHTCVACPLICDDIVIDGDRLERACGHGVDAIRRTIRQTSQEALADDARPTSRAAEAWEHGRPLDRGVAIRAAAATLVSARRVLVTGLAAATLESVAAACDIAELLAAAVDAGLPESSRSAGPTIARAGEVTAGWEELRDRADLVVFWCVDPARTHPRFIERFVGPALADGRPRRTIAVGPDSVMPVTSAHRHLPLDRELAVEAARWLHLRLSGRHQASIDSPIGTVSTAIEDAVRSAACIAIVTGESGDSVGLEAWSIVHLVRTIAHEKQAFQIPLMNGHVGAGPSAGGVNAAGAAAVCAWRYGAAGAIARADRTGGVFLPAESDARRLIDRGEVDAALVLGALDAPLERSIADRGETLSLVRICDAADKDGRTDGQTSRRGIRLRCADLAAETAGTMLREDGRRVILAPYQQPSLPQMRNLLVDLADALRRSSAASPAGGRP